MKTFSADILQDIFRKVDSKEKTKNDIASFYGRSLCMVNNYFRARKFYLAGDTVDAKSISRNTFTEWAEKYGKHGTPTYKEEDPNRKHVKKTNKQLSVEDLCELESPQLSDELMNLHPWEQYGPFYEFIKDRCTFAAYENGFWTLKARREDWESLF